MHKADPPQLTIVEYGRKFGFTISGIYIQTIGPRDSPKLAIKVKRPSRIKKTDAAGFNFWIKKPIAMTRLVITDPITPAWRIVFLPYLVIREDPMRQVATC